ncbi:hypothetical protein [Parasphingopyxis lamellibrachiae]|uniref:DUF3828 domain-containing protein n=1 Tax=Parasphingopyxis lamellibrachiae TaxID=680125 RepID=A0A3D9FD68_9SPHN|nr:hypothetical protein [Parasphingopyxis lamellibrachiae]RED15512.1 hypothetical protein DFR46_0507 [Parasphingopyxis lamellibrachiae]
MPIARQASVVLAAFLLSGCFAEASNSNPAEPEFAASETTPDADLESARTFVESVYQSYIDGNGIEAFSAVIAPELLALMGDEYGADPLCACQDFGDFSYAIERMEAVDDDVIAEVSFSNFGSGQTVALRLSRTDGEWRVADIGYPDMPSLADALRDGS